MLHIVILNSELYDSDILLLEKLLDIIKKSIIKKKLTDNKIIKQARLDIDKINKNLNKLKT